MKYKSLLARSLLLSVFMCSACSAAEWVQTWGAAPLPPTPAQGPFPATPSFSNQTVRQTIRVSVGGTRIRLRLTNEYGTKPLALGAVRVALADEKGNVRIETGREVSFSGKRTAMVPPGAPYFSDPIELPVSALSSLSVSIYLPEDTGACTCHATGVQRTFVSDTGDFTAKDFTPVRTMESRAFISGVEVETSGTARAVVVLGDSISDGMGSSVDANRRWPDLLANRLNEKGARGWGVVNMGISGNRVLNDGAAQNALARFDRDVLSVTGVQAVVLFEGVNDLGLSYGKFEGPIADFFKSLTPAQKATEEAMIAGYRQLIARARARGLKVFAATITPYGGALYHSPQGEAVRQAINKWIRTSGEVDGVLDFDAAVRDASDPARMKDGFHSGDRLHGSDAGYAAMAAAVDLSLFK